MADPAVIDAYLGTHHDSALTFEEEQQQLADIEHEVKREILESDK